MENIESRESAIRWYRHFMDAEIERLIAEFRSVLVADDEEVFPSIEYAMIERAPNVKQELESEYGSHECPDCGVPMEETPPEVPGIFCPECGELW